MVQAEQQSVEDAASFKGDAGCWAAVQALACLRLYRPGFANSTFAALARICLVFLGFLTTVRETRVGETRQGWRDIEVNSWGVQIEWVRCGGEGGRGQGRRAPMGRAEGSDLGLSRDGDCSHQPAKAAWRGGPF